MVRHMRYCTNMEKGTPNMAETALNCKKEVGTTVVPVDCGIWQVTVRKADRVRRSAFTCERGINRLRGYLLLVPALLRSLARAVQQSTMSRSMF